MGIVPVDLKEDMKRFLRSNAERTDAVFGSVSAGDIPTDSWEKWAARNWLQEDAIRYQTYFNSTDGLNVITSGSAGINLRYWALRLETGTTSGSKVQVSDAIVNDGLSVDPTWEKARMFRIGPDLRQSASNRTDYWATGQPSEGIQGVGFKYDGSDLMGIVHDGGEETTTEPIINTPGTGHIGDLRVEYYPNDRAVFYLNGSKEAELTAGLPTGSSDSDRLFDLSVSNSVAESRQTDISELRMIQLA